MLIKFCWFALAILVHGAPSLVFFRPDMIGALYGVSSEGDLATLLVHRSAMFFGILAVSLFALFDHRARRAASLIVAISMLSFLYLYLGAGAPEGPLRKIAIVDAIGLAPLAVVIWDAWRRKKQG